MPSANPQALLGRRILIVEDEFLIAEDMAGILAAHGAEVVGPVSSVPEAVAVLTTGGPVDGALLDLNLSGTMSYPVAELLAERHVPFAFATGYDRTHIPDQFAAVPRLEKPIDALKAVTVFQERA